jgi:ATP-binding cassette subfamily F protein 3
MIRELANRLVIFQHGGAQLFEGNYDDFLERFGWEEETLTLEGTSETKESALSKKDLRKRRAELTAERSRTVTPLKKRMDSIEKEIIELEEREKEHVAALTKASEEGEHKALREHSVAIGEIKQKIETLFSELESVSEQLKVAERTLSES